MRLASYGISVELPATWEGRIYRRPQGFPILHAATFALPAEDGDFGSGAVASMRSSDTFAALLEFDPELAFTGIFGPSGLPLPMRVEDASPKALQRLLPKRTAIQRFFTESGRAFCLYSVFPSDARLPRMVADANHVLGTITIAPRSTP